jgi:carbonic anhydrase/acetyltransferase-like protein (isoleucine patch superfamily)
MSIESYNNITPTLGSRCYLHDSSTVIGDVSLGDDCSVWPQTTIRGDVNYIRIGAGSNIQDNSVLHVTHAGPYSGDGAPLIIGELVTVGHGVILHACTIGHRCLIGMGAIVMDGAIIEDDAMVGAGALIPPGKRVASGELWVGNPAKLARPLSDRERESLRYSAEHYIKVKDRYLGGA